MIYQEISRLTRQKIMKDLDLNRSIGIYIVVHDHKETWIKKAVTSILSAIELIDESFSAKVWLIDTSENISTQEVSENIALNYSIPYLNFSGLSLNRVANKALEFVESTYIVRLDADDWVDVQFLNEVVESISLNPYADAFIPAYTEVSEDESVIRKVIRNDLLNCEVLDNPCHGACTVFRTDFIKMQGGYSTTIDRQDGYYIWLRLIKNGSFALVPNAEFFYRQHGANLTSSVSKLWEARYQILIDWMWDTMEDSYVMIVPAAKLGTVFEEVYNFPIKGRPYLFWYLDKIKEFKNVIIYGDIKYKEIADQYGFTFSLRTSNSNDQWHDIRLDVSEIISTHYPTANYISVCNIEYPFTKTNLIKAALSSTKAFSVDACITGEEINRDIYTSSSTGLVKIKEALSPSSKRFYRRSGCVEVRDLESFKNHAKRKVSFLPLDSLSSMRITSVDQLNELGIS